MHARREDTGRLQSYSRAVCDHVVCEGKQAQREVGHGTSTRHDGIVYTWTTAEDAYRATSTAR